MVTDKVGRWYKENTYSDYMNYSLNSLKNGLLYRGLLLKVLKKNARSLDYSSYEGRTGMGVLEMTRPCYLQVRGIAPRTHLVRDLGLQVKVWGPSNQKKDLEWRIV